MITIIIPCYNESDNLDQMYTRIQAVCCSIHLKFEVIVIDDGSDSKTWNKLREINNQNACWKIIRLSRNFGHQSAISAGLYYSTGDAVVILDADLQDPPELIESFIEKWNNGYDIVYGIRSTRKENLFKRIAYSCFYKVLSIISDPTIPAQSGDFGLIDRKVVDIINAMPERNRFVRGLRNWSGFCQIGIPYDRNSRLSGFSKFNYSKLFRLAFNGFFSFSYVPLRITTFAGMIISFIAFIGTIFTLLQRIFATSFAIIGLEPVPGYATIVISILFLGGLQLLSIGIIGEYIGRIYDEVKRRPNWIVRDFLGNFSEESFETNQTSSKWK